jgi:RimJ/RimL family protein N-acetyltransferase
MLPGRTVRLRALERDDLKDVVRWFNDPAVRALVARSTPMSMAEEERWFDGLLKSTTEAVFVIETLPSTKNAARSIGLCGMNRIDWKNRNCVVGIMIGDTADRGVGHGTDAMRCLVDHAVLDLGLHRVELEVYVDNAPARRSYEKLGFVVEGVRRQAMFKGGVFKDNVVMSVLAPEWRAASPTPTSTTTSSTSSTTTTSTTTSRTPRARRRGAVTR